jgi:hypothetical protein
MMATMMMLHLFLSMFMLLVMLITRLYVLIGTWRTTQENSATTILYGSGLG